MYLTSCAPRSNALFEIPGAKSKFSPSSVEPNKHSGGWLPVFATIGPDGLAAYVEEVTSCDQMAVISSL